MAKVAKEKREKEEKEKEMVEKDEAKAKRTKVTKVARVKTKARTRVRRAKARMVNLAPLVTRDALMPRVGKSSAG